MQEQPIDVVYTWVNGHDPEHQRLARQYAAKPRQLNPERTRDIYTLLKYSLRSVHCYVPWIRDIYILTMRPQAPGWLNRAHPRVKVIHHDEVFDQQYLPTFNSHAIESYLHRIPGVSEYFLYLNDDHLFGRAVERTDFLGDDGRIQLYSTFWGEPIPFIYDNKINGLVSKLQHIPFLVYKPYWTEMLRRWHRQVANTRSRKFRHPRCLDMGCLYRYHLVTRRRRQIRVVPALEYLKYHRFQKVTNDLNRQHADIAAIREQSPKFICLNDDQRDAPHPEVVALVQRFLEECYPEPSPYESEG